jgi:hypothetical protein
MNIKTHPNHTGFKISRSEIKRGIFLPKYYDPEISERLEALSHTHLLITLEQLIDDKHVHTATGNEIGKMSYGTGNIPFVRTSDVSNWEIKTDAKQGVSTEVFHRYGTAQDVRAGDIFFVRDGTYLIGQTALVMEADLPLLYQSHILKLRVAKNSPVSAFLLLACLSAPVVKRQIRSRKFTADIIDTIGDRYRELVLPIPRDQLLAEQIEREVQRLTAERSRLRDKIKKIPYWVEGTIASLEEEVPDEAVTGTSDQGNTGFLMSSSLIRKSVFMPKYYDPKLEGKKAHFEKTHRLVSIGRLVRDGVLSWTTGIEVGKMAYGTGDIPFVRTSDISNWELKGDPKQAVSEDIYMANRQDVIAGDIFVVRDGTYLVGTSCILTEADTRILYCGGLYKFRCEKRTELDPYLFLALLNSPFVRRQMRSKQFTRDIIDTLGKRIFEVLLPIPHDALLRRQIADETRNVIETRAKLRDRTKEIAFEVEGLDIAASETLDEMEDF